MHVSNLRSNDVRHGLVAMLPQHRPVDSIVNYQPWINDGAFNHPVVIVGTKCNNQIACCLVTTSFGSVTIEQKYKNPSNPMRLQYVPIYHGNTSATTASLTLNNNQRMLKKSYVHLDQWIEIETHHLRAWDHNKRFLTDRSTKYLQSRFTDNIEGRIPRPPPNRACSSPLDNRQGRVYTRESLGIPLTVPELGRKGSCSSLSSDCSEDHNVSLNPRASVFTPAASSASSSWRTGTCAVQVKAVHNSDFSALPSTMSQVEATASKGKYVPPFRRQGTAQA